MGGTLIKLKELKDGFTKNEKKIAEYLLENSENIKEANTYNLAEKCEVGQATVVRFAKKLGFKGFPELKLSLVSELFNKKQEKKVDIISDEIKIDDSTENLAHKVAYENIRSIESSLKTLSYKEIDRAVEVLEKSEKIFILGAGSSSIVAKDMQYKMWELGKNVVFDTDQHIQLGNVSMAKKEDCVFVISYSGKTLDIYNTLLEYKKKGVTIISLTQIQENPIKDIADIKLTTLVEKKDFRSNSLSTRMTQLTVIDILYVKMIQNDRDKADILIGEALENVKIVKMK